MLKLQERVPETLKDAWQLLLQTFRDVPEKRDPLIVTIGATETAISHGLGATPRNVRWFPRANQTIWESSTADERFVYLTASAEVEARLEIEP